MTVSKSKYYMLKVNFKQIFEQVDFETSDMSMEEVADSQTIEAANEAGRIYRDLKRSDIEKSQASMSKQDLLNRLRNPINVAESGEKLNSEQASK